MKKIVLYIPDDRFFPRNEENDYCKYAGECTIGCHECRYFEKKDGAE